MTIKFAKRVADSDDYCCYYHDFNMILVCPGGKDRGREWGEREER